MRLISISANQKSFKKIKFNPSGASFIIAKQKDPQQSDKNKTYNGVGKSLLIALINFCLGAGSGNKITKALGSCESLKDWVFTLKIRIKDKSYTITRSVNNHKQIKLNDATLKVEEFNQQMQELCFDIEQDFQYLTYRSLLSFFLRPSKNSYTKYDEPERFGRSYQKLLCNAFLLGLDVVLADKKMELKEQLDARNRSLRETKEDPVIREFFGHNQNTPDDYQLVRANIKEEIKKLEEDLRDYQVADDYYQYQEKADRLKKQLDEKQNQIYLHENTVKRIDKSLRFEVDIDPEIIKNIYQESQMVFQPEVEKRLSDLGKFYQDLRTNRTKRLGEQKRSVLNELSSLENEAKKLKEQFDKCSEFLESHGALDVFTQLNKQLSELKQKREGLDNFGELQRKYKKEIAKLKQNLGIENSKTIYYLEESEPFLTSVDKGFRTLAKEFYPDATLAGISIANNDGINQLRYNIEAKIQSDSSDGINSVKLFCYDLNILLGGNKHKMDFIFHDSRLFSDIDEMHCGVLFDIVKSKFQDKQYIASINQKDLTALQPEVQDFIETHKVYELTDESEEGKLLGMSVELAYD